jgi:hypothetical protein
MPGRSCGLSRQRRGTLTQLPAHNDLARSPLVPVRAPLRVIPAPPIRTLHPHDTIRTRVRFTRARQQHPKAGHPSACSPASKNRNSAFRCRPTRRQGRAAPVLAPGTRPDPTRGASVCAAAAAHLDPRCAAIDPVAHRTRRQRQRRLIASNHGSRRPGLPGGHQVVWYWQAVAVVRSLPVRDQLNQPAWPLGLPVAWSLNSGS